LLTLTLALSLFPFVVAAKTSCGGRRDPTADLCLLLRRPLPYLTSSRVTRLKLLQIQGLGEESGSPQYMRGPDSSPHQWDEGVWM
ncbi:hypothetical protein Taro_020597, partial [Colocasia esculenta]|nr:hypothetical protein [Colocasia esculenta]